VYSELSLLTVEVCKVNMDSISVAQDSGSVVQRVGVNGNWTWGTRLRLHADLVLFSWALDQTRVAVVSRIMVGREEVGREKFGRRQSEGMMLFESDLSSF
jgi:hypothetical protein